MKVLCSEITETLWRRLQLARKKERKASWRRETLWREARRSNHATWVFLKGEGSGTLWWLEYSHVYLYLVRPRLWLQIPPCTQRCLLCSKNPKYWTYLPSHQFFFFLPLSPSSQVLVNPSLSCCHMRSYCERAGELRESRSLWSLRRSSACRNARGMH